MGPSISISRPGCEPRSISIMPLSTFNNPPLAFFDVFPQAANSATSAKSSGHIEVNSPPGPNLHTGPIFIVLSRSIFLAFNGKSSIGKSSRKGLTKTEQKQPVTENFLLPVSHRWRLR
jgi:hypothetical protein